MSDYTSWLTFSVLCLTMAITPGPNMLHLISRSSSQGRKAGLISLSGIMLGFVIYMNCAAFGITALVIALPYLYDMVRVAGATYFAFLAFKMFRYDGRAIFEVKSLLPDGPKKLFAFGLLTSMLNPKLAVMYLSLLPQFVDTRFENILQQFFILGFTQIAISFLVNAAVVFFAGYIANFSLSHPAWMKIPGALFGTVLAVFAVRLLFDERR